MIAWFRHAVRSAGASLAGVAVVSAILTASVALPLGTSSERSDQVIDTALVVADDDTRFPEPVPLGAEELAVLAEAVDASSDRGDDGTEDLAAGVGSDNATPTGAAGAEATTAPTTAPSSTDPEPTDEPEPTPAPTATAEPPADSEPEPETGLDDVPTPTAGPTAAPTPPPIPTSAPEPTPRPVEPTPTPTVRPRSTVPPRTPTPAPSPDPTTEPSVGPDEAAPTPTVDPFPPQTVATDLYAYVFDAELVQNEEGTVRVKAGNQGDETATGVVMSISTSGGTILSITPRRADWTCSGVGANWTCSGPHLEAHGFSRTIVSVLPGTTDLTVAVTVSHEVVDLAPGNNSATARIRVAPDPDPDPRVLRPLEALRPTVSPEATPAPTPTPTTAIPPDPAPTVPSVQEGVGSLVPGESSKFDSSTLLQATPG